MTRAEQQSLIGKKIPPELHRNIKIQRKYHQSILIAREKGFTTKQLAIHFKVTICTINSILRKQKGIIDKKQTTRTKPSTKQATNYSAQYRKRKQTLIAQGLI